MASRGAARPQDLPVAVLYRGCRLRHQRVFHPAVERNLCGGKCGSLPARPQHRGQSGCGLAAHRRDRNRQFRGFALDRVAPVVVIIAHLEQAVARAQGTIKRGDPRRMLTVDGQNEAIEKAPPLRCRSQKQSVHRGRQPHHAQVVAERRRRGHRFAVDTAAPAARGGIGRRRVDAGAERGQSQRALDFGGNRPRAVALIVGNVLQHRPAQPATRRQKRNRLDAIGFSGAVRARQHHHVAPRLKARRAIVAEMRELEAVNAGSGHCSSRHGRVQ